MTVSSLRPQFVSSESNKPSRSGSEPVTQGDSEIGQVASKIIAANKSEIFDLQGARPGSSLDQTVQAFGDTYAVVKAAFSDPSVKKQLQEAYKEIGGKAADYNRKVNTFRTALEGDWNNLAKDEKARFILERIEGKNGGADPQDLNSPYFKDFLLGMIRSFNDAKLTGVVDKLQTAISGFDGSDEAKKSEISKLRKELKDGVQAYLKDTSGSYLKTTRALITAQSLLKINNQNLSFKQVAFRMIGIGDDKKPTRDDLGIKDKIPSTYKFSGFESGAGRIDLSAFNSATRLDIPPDMLDAIGVSGDVTRSNKITEEYRTAQQNLAEQISNGGNVNIPALGGATQSFSATSFEEMIRVMGNKLDELQKSLPNNYRVPSAVGSNGYNTHLQIINLAGQIKLILGLKSLRDGVFSGTLPLADDNLRKNNADDYKKVKPLLESLDKVNREYDAEVAEAGKFLTPVLQNIFSKTVNVRSISSLPVKVGSNTVIAAKLSSFRLATADAVRELGFTTVNGLGPETNQAGGVDPGVKAAGFAFGATLSAFEQILAPQEAAINSTKEAYKAVAENTITAASKSITNLIGSGRA